MNHLKGIPIAVDGALPGAARSHGNAMPLLHEIEVLLSDLVSTGKSASIDLRSLPMLPDDHEKLRAALGDGEVSATIDAMGPTQVRETAVHGVWWVTHYNSDDNIIAEFIEVTYVPEILRTHPADARLGLDGLRARLTESTETDKGDADV
jgi:HupH hydrogenase expression protein, C-terminal conserved region